MRRQIFLSIVLSFYGSIASGISQDENENNFLGEPPSDDKSNFHLENKKSALDLARALTVPKPMKTVGGEYEHMQFWEQNEGLLKSARQEWGCLHEDICHIRRKEQSSESKFEFAAEHFIKKEFKILFDQVWKDPTPENEAAVRSLFTETEATGVYSFQPFTSIFLQKVKEEIQHQMSSGIPLRRPNGMNRYGAIINEIGLGQLIHTLIENYFRPVSQLLFPKSVTSDDTKEYFSFLVKYKKGEDVDLAEHTDASTVTVNMCLGNNFEDGAIYFKNVRHMYSVNQTEESKMKIIPMEAGLSLIHLGQHVHGALPLTSGERLNIITWMYGQDGYVRIAPYTENEVGMASRSPWQTKKNLGNSVAPNFEL